MVPKGIEIDSTKYGCFDSANLVYLLTKLTQGEECLEIQKILWANDSIYRKIIANDEFIIENLKANLKNWEEVGKITEKQYENAMKIVGNLERQVKMLKFWNSVYRIGFVTVSGILVAVLLVPK